MLSYFREDDRFSTDSSRELHKLVTRLPVAKRKDAWLAEMKPSLLRITNALIRKSLKSWEYPELPPALNKPLLIVGLEGVYYLLCFKTFMVLVYRLGIMRDHRMVLWLARQIGFIREDTKP